MPCGDFTGIYGEPRTELRGKTWEVLRYLRRQDDLPWLCAGDFNEILKQEGQIGVNDRNEQQMESFRECLADCSLIDLGYTGYTYTWDKKRGGAANVQAGLDRATGTDEFLQLFPNRVVEHIATEETDHIALLIKIAGVDVLRAPKPRGFVFEEMWTKHDSYNDMMLAAWQENKQYAKDLAGLWSRLKGVSSYMKRWSYETFGSVHRQIKKLRAALGEAKIYALGSGSMLEVQNIESELHKMYDREEVMYRQRSRQDWLKAGDRNTKYFQNRASHRKRKNTIRFLNREYGSRCSTDDEMRDWARSFYSKPFCSEGAMDLDRILNKIVNFVTPEMNDALTATVSKIEIEEVLFQMGPTKSPGLDGLPALFYQRHWAVLKSDICAAVKDFLEGKACPDDFNDTTLVLIPKVNSPVNLTQF
jgi:hypothetical protein